MRQQRKHQWDTYGYPRALWDEAKTVMRQAIIDDIRLHRDPLTYTQVLVLVRHMIDFQGPHNPILWSMLGQMSEDEEPAGRGLLSAYVVRADLNRPGNLYFDLACSIRPRWKRP